ncbi:Vitamin B12 transporter BtuB [biofilm metagenome]
MQKLITIPLLLAGINVQAQENKSSQPQALPEMLVTATRVDTPKNQLTAGTSVYTRADIERLQVKTFPDLLRGTTGIDMTQQGGDGKTTSIFMRGTNSDHLLVLVDGIKMGSVTLGTTSFEFIPIDQIERVEIIRGPQSSLYGSEAIGGVIQIFTRKGAHSDIPKFTLDTGGGNYSTLKASGTVSGQWENSWYNFGASHYNIEGFNSCQKNGACFADEPDADGYYNTAVNGRIGHHFENNADLEASFMRSSGRTEFDGTLQNKTKFINQVAALTGSMYVLENWKSTLRLGQSLDQNDNFSPTNTLFSRFDSTRWNATWLNEIDISERHQVVFGTDYRLDEIDTSDRYQKNSRYDVGVFGELHSQVFDDHFVNASLRWDHNEAFGDYVTGNIGWRYNSPIGISPFANFGNAFKAPSFNSLYFPTLDSSFQGTRFIFQGNPDLKPEESTTVEVGLIGKHDGFNWEARAFHTTTDNLIADKTTLINPATSFSQPENINKAQIDGLELEVNTQLLGWNNQLNMTWLDPRDRETNVRLLRRYQKSLSYDLSRTFKDIDVGVNVLAQGNRNDIDFTTGSTVKVAGFVTVDLRAAYHIDKNWTINAKLNNLLDKQYQTVNTYNTADRNFFLSIHYNN